MLDLFRYIYMKVKINVPNDLSEIKLWQYQKFLKIQNDNTDEHFIAAKMIEIFCHIESKDVFKMKAKDIAKITNIIADVFQNKPKLKQRIKLNNIDYGFIPNLDDMSLGEYIDLDTYISKWDEIEKAMAVLYRPITQTYKDKYNIEEYTAKNADKYKDITLDVVFGSIIFFYHLGIDLSRVMANYLEVNQKMNLAEQNNSVNAGDGINQFSLSLKEILEDLKISLN